MISFHTIESGVKTMPEKKQNSQQQAEHDQDMGDKLATGYDEMLEKLSEWAEKSNEKAGPLLLQGMEETSNFFQQVGQWSRDEIDLISRYLSRDLHHMAKNLEKNNQKLVDWLEIDEQKVEEKLLQLLSHTTDHTRKELDHLKFLAEHAEELHTGEVTTIGTIVCKNCGKEMHFYKSGRIPPCSACHQTLFTRKQS